MLILRLAGVGLFFGITLFLTNFFNPETVGRYDFSRSIIMFFGGICVLGMHQSVIFYSGFLKANNATGHLRSVYLKMLRIVLIIAILLLGITLLVSSGFINSFFEKEDAAPIFIKTIGCLFFYAVVMLNFDVFRAVDKIYVSEFYRNILRYLFFGIGVLTLHFLDLKSYLVDVFLLNFILIALLSTSFLLYCFTKKEKYQGEIEVSTKQIIRRSAPMAISALSYILMQSVDVILLSKFTDFDQVAFYAVALKLTMIISLVLASVNTVIAPKLAELFSSERKDELKYTIQKATRLTFGLTIIPVLFLILASEFVLGIFGEPYKTAKTALFILLIGQTVNAFCGSVGVYMNMTGKQNVLQWILSSAFVLNLILNWFLIPVYGIEGAAIATAVSMIFWKVFTVIYIYRTDRVKTFLSY